MASEITTRDQLLELLTSSKVVAVLGAHPEQARAAYYVPDYLSGVGYRILPVNPGFVGQTLWGEPFRATLAELGEAVDVVDVFRRSSWLPQHVDDILAMAPGPATCSSSRASATTPLPSAWWKPAFRSFRIDACSPTIAT